MRSNQGFVLTAAVLAVAAACTSGPRAVDTRAKLEDHDLSGAIATYRDWRKSSGGDDRVALRAMALGTLYGAMKSQSPAARRLAIEAAWDLDEPQLGETVAQLLDDDDETVRATAAAALLKAHPDAGRVLGDTLKSSDPEARRIAVRAIGERVGKRAREDIVAALADPDPGVRAVACGALEHAWDAGSDPGALAELVGSDKSGLVRAAALRTLTAKKATGALDAARAALADDYLGARLAAVEAVAALGGANTDLEPIAAGAEPFSALRAGVALAKRGERAPGLAAFTAAAGSSEWTVRVAAVNALPRLAEHDDALQRLAGLAGDSAPEVRLAVARAYIQLGQTERARTLLGDALALTDDGARLEASIDLLRLHDPRAAATLDAIMGSEQPGLRAGAAQALRSGGTVSDALLGLLLDDQLTVRVQAAWTILKLR